MLSILPKPARQGVTIILARPLKLKYIIGSLHGRKSAFLSPQPQEKNTLEMGPRSYGNRHTFRCTGFQEPDGWQVNFTVTKPD